eukprot:2190496-Prymnesium_polylepis.1
MLALARRWRRAREMQSSSSPTPSRRSRRPRPRWEVLACRPLAKTTFRSFRSRPRARCRKGRTSSLPSRSPPTRP